MKKWIISLIILYHRDIVKNDDDLKAGKAPIFLINPVKYYGHKMLILEVTSKNVAEIHGYRMVIMVVTL